MEAAEKIVTEFEDIFGDLSATERDWLIRRILALLTAGLQQVSKP